MKILWDMGVFEYIWKELEFWLEYLENIMEEDKEIVI